MSEVAFKLLETKRKSLGNLSLLLLSLFLSSCSVPITWVLYNNTSSKVKIIQLDNSVVKETIEVMPGESTDLEEWEDGHYNYQIAFKDLTWRYDKSTPYIPNFNYDYVETTGFGLWVERLVFVQLEKDGSIFLLRKGQKQPISITEQQPKGYPLIPLKENIP